MIAIVVICLKVSDDQFHLNHFRPEILQVKLIVQNFQEKTTITTIQFLISDNCGDCYGEILAAATDCILSFDWKPCVEDVLGAGTPCIECVCEVIADISSIFNLDWSC